MGKTDKKVCLYRGSFRELSSYQIINGTFMKTQNCQKRDQLLRKKYDTFIGISE